MINKKIIIFITIILLYSTIPNSYSHTIDSVADKYRLEIGWMNEPVVSGETNGIELFVSKLEPCTNQTNSQKCAESQSFKNGIQNLEKTLKMQLVYKNNKIILPLKPDHNIIGKYYAFVDPTLPGFYQANILGDIEGTTVSISMHPPKVNEREYIEFPEKEGKTVRQIIESHTTIIDEINSMKSDIKNLQESNPYYPLSLIAIITGLVGIAIGTTALIKVRH